MSDPPHGVKKWRNALFNPKRHLRRDDHHLKHQHIIDLFLEETARVGLTKPYRDLLPLKYLYATRSGGPLAKAGRRNERREAHSRQSPAPSLHDTTAERAQTAVVSGFCKKQSSIDDVVVVVVVVRTPRTAP